MRSFSCRTRSSVTCCFARISALHAAVAIDDAAGLKERLSTALTCRRDADPFAQAAVHDAEKTQLSDEVIEHLEALGYGAAEFD